jgi:GxxExxY protein
MHPIDHITDLIIGSAIEVHRRHGPGLLESVYLACLGQELVEKDLDVHINMPLSLDYKGLHLHRAYVLDLLVENSVIVEIKCVRKLTDLDVAQLLTYLRLTNLRVGLLINFNVTKLKHGLRRVVNRHVDDNGRLLPWLVRDKVPSQDAITTQEVETSDGPTDEEQ